MRFGPPDCTRHAWCRRPDRHLAGNDVDTMTLIYVVAGILAVLLLAYLFVALLSPERFG
jgi:K+-transporting ATPase KdpF subunit